jgi:hypothetical protein
MGRRRQYLGTNELPSIDLRSRKLKEALAPAARAGSPLTVSLEADGVPLRLTFSPCRFGGRRAWFVCEGCGRERIVLYRREVVTVVHNDGVPREERQRFLWRCRRCWHLTYPSQRTSRNLLGTAQVRLEALCRRFKPDWSYGDDYFDKPPRIRHSTWQRFCEAVEGWEEKRWEDFATTVFRRFGRYLK